MRSTLDSLKNAKRMNFLNKNICVCVTALLAIGCVVAIAHAQEQAPHANRQPPGQQQNQPGFARQLTHETREAAGEEKDETAEFKESPSVQFIARHTGLSNGHAYLLSILLNFAVIAILIGWAANKYLPHVFSARTAAIQKAMQEAQKASEEARRRLADIENRLKKLDSEIGMMRDNAEKDAAAEEARIQAAAQEDAHKMLESAQQEIASAAKAARRELTAYAADLAIGLAKRQIHVDANTDQALVRNFAGELGAYSDSPRQNASPASVPRSNAPGKDGH